MYNCEQCDRTLSTPNNLRRHIASVHDNRRYVCNKCGNSYSERSNLVRHIKYSHKGDGIANPSVYIYLSKDEIKRKSSKPLFRCEKCDQTFNTYKVYNCHVRNIHPEKTEQPKASLIDKFKCQKCNDTFRSSRSLLHHTKKIHMNQRYLCPECSSNYSSRTSLRAHLIEKHNGIGLRLKSKLTYGVAPRQKQVQELKCKKCDLKFTSHSGLNRHIKNIHEHLRYLCQKCEQKFKTLYDLTLHRRVKHDEESFSTKVRPTPPSQDASFKCTKCDLTHGTRSGLNHHYKTVHENRRYLCKQCGRNFCRRQSFSKHFKDKHPRANLLKNLVITLDRIPPSADTPKSKKSKVIRGQKLQSTNRKLNLRLSTVTSRTKSSTKAQNLDEADCSQTLNKCDKCDRLFSKPFNLNLHIMCIHTKKNLSICCEICESSYKANAALLRHIKAKHRTANASDPEDSDTTEEAIQDKQVKEEPIIDQSEKTNETNEEDNDDSELKEIYDLLPDDIRNEKSLTKFEEKFQNFLLQIKNEILC